VNGSLPLGDRAARLRDLFDRSFQSTPTESAPQTEDFLLIRVGNLPYAVRVSEVSAVAAHRRVVPVPSRRTDLLGLAGIRGSLVCVYGLAALLGHAPDATATWLALCGGAEAVGLAFQELEVFVRAPRADVHEDPSTAKRLVNGVVQIGRVARPIVDLGAVANVITSRTGVPAQPRSPT
jgi:chemotaxis signal transduction protein